MLAPWSFLACISRNRLWLAWRKGGVITRKSIKAHSYTTRLNRLAKGSVFNKRTISKLAPHSLDRSVADSSVCNAQNHQSLHSFHCFIFCVFQHTRAGTAASASSAYQHSINQFKAHRLLFWRNCLSQRDTPSHNLTPDELRKTRPHFAARSHKLRDRTRLQQISSSAHQRAHTLHRSAEASHCITASRQFTLPAQSYTLPKTPAAPQTRTPHKRM